MSFLSVTQRNDAAWHQATALQALLTLMNSNNGNDSIAGSNSAGM